MASILIIESDALIGGDLCGFLTREGQQAVCALDCPEAMQLLSSSPRPDAVVLNPHGMDVTSCIELIGKLSGLSIPVIVWTLNPGEQFTRLKALNLPHVVFAPGVAYRDILLAIFQNTPQPDPTKPNQQSL